MTRRHLKSQPPSEDIDEHDTKGTPSHSRSRKLGVDVNHGTLPKRSTRQLHQIYFNRKVHVDIHSNGLLNLLLHGILERDGPSKGDLPASSSHLPLTTHDCPKQVLTRISQRNA